MIYQLRKQCNSNFCFATAEYTLVGMSLCKYHFIKLNNELFTKDGMAELMRLLD